MEYYLAQETFDTDSKLSKHTKTLLNYKKIIFDYTAITFEHGSKMFENDDYLRTLSKKKLSDFFICICVEGDLELLDKFMLYENLKITKNAINLGFIASCEFGHLIMSKILYTHYKSKIDLLAFRGIVFYSVCINNYVNVLQWLTTLRDYTSHVCFFRSAEKAVDLGLTNIVTFLYSQNNDVFKHIDRPIYLASKSTKTHPELVQFVSNHYSPNSYTELLRGLQNICLCGNLQVFKSIYNKFKQNCKLHEKVKIISYCFTNSCNSGNLELVKHIYKLLFKFMVSDDLISYLKKGYFLACENNHKHIVYWLHNIYYPFDENTFTPNEKELLFLLTSETNGVELFRFFFEQFIKTEEEKHEILKIVLLGACKHGTKQIIDAIPLVYHNFNISDYGMNPLEMAIYYGHLMLSNELFEYYKTNNIQITDFYYNKWLYFCCNKGYGAIFKCLFKQMKDDGFEPNYNSIMETACDNGCLDILQYVYTVLDNNFDLRFENDYLFKCSVRNKHIFISLWLSSIVSDYKITVNKFGKYTFSIKKEFFVKEKKYKFVDKIEDCCVCYEKSQVITNCGHQYCNNCLNKMCKFMYINTDSDSNCALCRTKVVSCNRIKEKK